MKFMEFLGWYPLAISHGLNPLLNTYVNLPHGSDMMWDTTIPFVAVTLWPVTALLGRRRLHILTVASSRGAAGRLRHRRPRLLRPDRGTGHWGGRARSWPTSSEAVLLVGGIHRRGQSRPRDPATPDEQRAAARDRLAHMPAVARSHPSGGTRAAATMVKSTVVV